MLPDVIDLRDFYESSLGHVARRLVRRQIREMWPDLRDMSVLGLGYATPYLRVFREEADRVVAIMPAEMGVLRWPKDGPNATTLALETDLPLADRSIGRVLAVHSIEATSHLPTLLRELWRVLEDGGRLLILVPNRGGIWARSDRTPFGSGQPYSTGQINRILRQSMFTPLRSSRALFLPPSRRRALLSAAPALEKIGQKWFKPLAGVSLVEASKTIYAGAAETRRAGARRYVTVGGAARQAGRPVGRLGRLGHIRS